MSAIHQAQLNKLLMKIADNSTLSQSLYFKGGTCATMSGFLDRLSVDLDFDIKPGVDKIKLQQEFYAIFKKLKFTIKSESSRVLQFFLRYPAPPNMRNTLEVDALGEVYKSNVYESRYLTGIDRIVNCQSLETMFANKLVAVQDRWLKHKQIVGRDIYDICHFFYRGFSYSPELIKERTGMEPKKYLVWLHKFIDERLTNQIIDEDLNTLLTHEQFQATRKSLKLEVLNCLSSVK